MIPLVVACVSGAAQGTTLFWVAFLLLCVACAVADIVFVSIVRGSHQKLLEEGDYTRENKQLDRRIGALPGIYWSLAMAVYLAVSFLTGRWDTSWIVWPVAGVLFPALLAVARAVVRGSLEE